jgi:hypothetical protein
MDLKTMTLKEKVIYVVSAMDMNENQTEFGYFEDMMNSMFENDPELPNIKEKMDNLISLLYDVKSRGEEEYQKFLDLDFETEIWEMI